MIDEHDCHDCMDFRDRVVLNEGDDVYHEQCQCCGAIRYESDGGRPMAWFLMPKSGLHGSWPWRYAYADPHNEPDAPEVWRPAEEGTDHA